VAVVYPTALTVLVTVAFANWRTIQPEPVARPHPNQTKRRNSTSRENDEETPRKPRPVVSTEQTNEGHPPYDNNTVNKIKKEEKRSNVRGIDEGRDMEDWLPDPRPQGVSIDPITQCRLLKRTTRATRLAKTPK